MVSTKDNHTSSRFIRSIKGVKLLLGRGDQHQKRQQKNQQDAYTKEGIAVTLTTEVNNHGSDQGPPTLLHPSTAFVPSRPAISSSFDNKAYVHYEPKLSQVTLGTSPDTKYRRSIKLSVERYAWLIQQFREEQHLNDALDAFFEQNGSEKSELEAPFTISPMLGVISIQNHTTSFSQRLIRFVQRRTTPEIYGQCIYLLPKALLLQAASYIPMTRSSTHTSSIINTHLLLNPPYQPIDEEYHKKLLRYCNYIPLCEHELALGEKKHDTLNHIVCMNCSLKTTLYQLQRQQSQPISRFSSFLEEPVMFPLSYIQYPITNNPFLMSNITGTHGNNESRLINTASAIPPQRRAFGSFSSNEKPHAYSAFQYIPPERTTSHSTDSISEFSGIIEEEEEDEDEEGEDNPNDDDEDERTTALEKHGFVAVDEEHEEIIVAFPGITVSHSMLKNTSFVPVPWTEVLEPQQLKQSHAEYIPRDKLNKKTGSDELEHQDQMEEDNTPWVLSCALTAWRRCEMRVVTLLMRLCSTMPAHYKVTIVGHSVGGAVASLCAYSLRSTKLLTEREITVVTIHAPRLGNKAFIQSLEEKVETIRITDPQDIMAHLPPRTSGLLHMGRSTVIHPLDETNNGFVINNLTTNQTEDYLSQTFLTSQYTIESHQYAWDVVLNNNINYRI